MSARLFQITVATIIFSFAFSKVPGQRNLGELSERIGTTRNFSRIQEIAKNYFEEERIAEASKQKTTLKNNDKEDEEEFESPEGFYHRWAWYNGARLDANGNVTDYAVKNIAAIVSESPANNHTTSLSSNSNWSLQGPVSNTFNGFINGPGRVDCIAFHPSNTNTMYAGTPTGGLWKTTDEGSSWNLIGGLYPFLGIGGVVVNSLNGNEIWALAGSAENSNTWGIFAMQGGCRVYHSADGGISWTATTTFPQIGNGGGFDLIQHPSNPNTLYAATTTDVYVTTDGGANWVRSGLGTGAYDLEIHPFSKRLYAVGESFVKYSDNNGIFWNNCSFDFSIIGMNRASLAISPAGTGNTIYLLAGPASAGSFKGLYKSTNAGLNFYRQSNTPNVFDGNTNGSGNGNQSNYDNCIVAHPTDVNKILTGGMTIWQSSNGGSTMTFNTYYWYTDSDPGRYVHADVHALKRNPVSNNIYACTDGGIYVSTNFGTSWSLKSKRLVASQAFHMATYKNNFFIEAIGLQDNGVHLQNTYGDYEKVASGDGYGVQFGLNDSSILYFTINNGFSKNGGSGTTGLPVTYPFATASDKWYILPKVTPSANNTEILFAAALDTLSRSTNGGIMWTTIVRRANWDIAYAPSNPAYIYTAGGENFSAPTGLQLSRNQNYGTGTWTNISGSFAAFGQRAMKIVADPFDALKVYVCFGGYTAGHKVYRSTNGGTNWNTNISYNLPNVPVNSLATDKGGNVYAGTDVGVYVLPYAATKWVAFYNNLPRVPVTELIVNDDLQFIKAATFGTGIWISNLYSVCPQNALVAFTQSGRQTIEASEFVNAYQVTMQGGYELTDVRLRAGDRIIFTPGSDLKNGTLVASIGPCGEPFSRIVPMSIKDSLLSARLNFPDSLQVNPVKKINAQNVFQKTTGKRISETKDKNE